MKNTKKLNENCKNYIQHYCYNKTLKTFMHTNCGHCREFKVNCDKCSTFIPRSDKIEEFEQSIHNQLSHVLYILNKIIKLFNNEK